MTEQGFRELRSAVKFFTFDPSQLSDIGWPRSCMFKEGMSTKEPDNIAFSSTKSVSVIRKKSQTSFCNSQSYLRCLVGLDGKYGGPILREFSV